MLRERAERALKAAAVRAIAVAVAGTAVGAALAGCVGFALVGIHALLLRETSPSSAAFLTAGAGIGLALLIAGLLVLGLRLARGGRSRGRGSSATSRHRAGDRFPPATVAEAADWIAANPRTASISALVAGVVFGLSPELRKTVAEAARAALHSRQSPD